MAYVKPGYWKAGYAVGELSQNITVANSQQTNTASPASIQQTRLITVADSQQVNTASAGAVTQSNTHYIAIADSQQVNTASDAAIAQTHLITITNSQQVNRASSAAINNLLNSYTRAPTGNGYARHKETTFRPQQTNTIRH